MNELEKEIKINKFKLDEENEIQPSLYIYYSELLADAKAEKDKAIDSFNLVKAEREMELRKNPPDGIKITEAAIEALLAQDRKIQKYETKIFEAKKRVYHLEAAVNALEHRKSALRNLTTLFVAGYYSLPERDKDINDQARKLARNKLNKKGKNK